MKLGKSRPQPRAARRGSRRKCLVSSRLLISEYVPVRSEYSPPRGIPLATGSSMKVLSAPRTLVLCGLRLWAPGPKLARQVHNPDPCFGTGNSTQNMRTWTAFPQFDHKPSPIQLVSRRRSIGAKMPKRKAPFCRFCDRIPHGVLHPFVTRPCHAGTTPPATQPTLRSTPNKPLASMYP